MSHLLHSVVMEDDDLEEERDKKCPSIALGGDGR